MVFASHYIVTSVLDCVGVFARTGFFVIVSVNKNIPGWKNCEHRF